MERSRYAAIVGILGIICLIVIFIGTEHGDGDHLVKVVKLVMAGVTAALGVAVATGGGDE